ncbi:uncharacterized protein JCM6883_005465 [Sporobolomyces salmoneus]|uniref:uncharacterized protein n=1 Tax=Sporobolomyces salmoneus TaxID=183962 RepID=UPI00317CA248
MALSTRGTHRTISHLLLTGHNPFSPPSNSSSSSSSRQSPSNPSLTPIPFSTWLSQIGRESDTFSPLSPPSITSISSATGHSLISYRNYEGVDRVIGLGRNESGQLGIGFASQEGTRGLVEGFEGEEVLKVETNVQGSYLLVKENETRNALYSIGNLSRGKLAQPNLYSRSPTPHEHEEDDSEPVMKILPRATLVEPPQIERFGKIVHLETGYEHLLVLTESGDLFGSGCNTDGQLGLSHSRDVYSLTHIPLPPFVKEKEGGIEKIVAGGDTSGFITKSGKLYTWGNSEYAQAGHGKKIDQITSPLEVLANETFLGNGERRVVDYRCGGSFGLILDDRHNLYSTGYGALGYSLPSDPSSSFPNLFNPHPTLIPSLSSTALGFSSPITRIRAAFGYAVAISDSPSSRSSLSSSSASSRGSRLWSWGLNSPSGRLGHGTISRVSNENERGMRVEPWVIEPREIRIPLRELGLEEKGEWGVGTVELGEEGMWVEVKERRRVEENEEGV